MSGLVTGVVVSVEPPVEPPPDGVPMPEGVVVVSGVVLEGVVVSEVDGLVVLLLVIGFFLAPFFIFFLGVPVGVD